MVKILFLHPDLGIGGAERLVVDAALALKAKQHEVRIVTSHHDVSHCFTETKNGELSVDAVGDWLPRTLFGKLAAFFATIRMLYAAFYVTLFYDFSPDIFICDQVSNMIPILKVLSRAKIIFYCHFPDQLLTKRSTFWKKQYRRVMDAVEEWTTGRADLILVNSEFTGGVFKDTFSSLAHITPDVLYPSLNTAMFDTLGQSVSHEDKDDFTILSLNRFERKKNIGLAIKALKILKENNPSSKLRLLIAGGYDSRVPENVEHCEELVSAAQKMGLESCVEFVKSPSDAEKVRLLKTCDCLVYTPSGEHFGIVPIEAMYNELPVVAVNDGGPTETVIDGETGFLREPTDEDFASALDHLLKGGPALKKKIGACGRKRVLAQFSFNSFAQKLDGFIETLLSNK